MSTFSNCFNFTAFAFLSPIKYIKTKSSPWISSVIDLSSEMVVVLRWLIVKLILFNAKRWHMIIWLLSTSRVLVWRHNIFGWSLFSIEVLNALMLLFSMFCQLLSDFVLVIFDCIVNLFINISFNKIHNLLVSDFSLFDHWLSWWHWWWR